jgi:hypothetical protein
MNYASLCISMGLSPDSPVVEKVRDREGHEHLPGGRSNGDEFTGPGDKGEGADAHDLSFGDKRFVKDNGKRITDAKLSEQTAVNVWLSGGYTTIKGVDKNGPAKPKEDHAYDRLVAQNANKYHSDFSSALEKAPIYEGKMYRGLGGMSDAEVKSFAVGAKVKFESLESFTITEGLASKFAGHYSHREEGPVSGHNVILHIPKGLGVNLDGAAGPYKGEKEIITPKGMKYKVVKVSEKVVEFAPNKHFTKKKIKQYLVTLEPSS